MTILLDTNAFIWWLADDSKLGPKARGDIADRANNVYISDLSLLECSLKARLGKLKIDFNEVDREISKGMLSELKYDTFAARQFVNQANLPQAEPFDSALVAQAVSKHMIFMTSDENIIETRVDGLQVIDAKY